MLVDTTPMILPLTTMTAGLTGLLVFGLAVYTMAQRVVHEQSWGDGEVPSLRLAIRAHSNLTEYAPVVLILMALLELRGADPRGLMAMGGLFILARVSYAMYALISQKLALRIIGFWGSALPIVAGALWLLIM